MLHRHVPYLVALLAFAPCFCACGGTVQFTGAPVVIAGTPPPPPPRPAAPTRAQLRNNKIEIAEKIQFEADKAIIKDASNSLLKEIADVMRANPNIKKISIEGHASAEGNAAHNKQLSADRANAVMSYLVTKEHIDASRLTAKGWGSEKPIASNDNEEGCEKNRRVDFLVVDQGGPTAANPEKK